MYYVTAYMHQHTGTHMYIHIHIPHAQMPWCKQLGQRGLGINMLPCVGEAARNVKLGLQNLRPNLSGVLILNNCFIWLPSENTVLFPTILYSTGTHCHLSDLS